MEFLVRSLRDRPDVMEVRYDCACGCKPRARYHRGSDEAGYEHCCCGQVHFAGARAEERLKVYLEERASQGMDEDVGGYSLATREVAAPWGGVVEVAYAMPRTPRPH